MKQVKDICFYNQQLFLSFDNNPQEFNKIIQFLVKDDSLEN